MQFHRSFLVLPLFCLQALADVPECPSNVINEYKKICVNPKKFVYVSGGLRTSASILISACAVYVACSWSILRFNVPDPAKSFWSRGWKIYNLVNSAFVTPEIMAMLSLMEYMNAYQHHQVMRALGAGHWSMMHAFMANMGGIALHAGDSAPFLVMGLMLEVLVKDGVIDIPDIDKDDIEDKSKTDLFGKIFTMLQAGWLILTTIARIAQGLGIAPIEMSACFHVLVSFMTYLLQWHKPQGVRVPITIKLPMRLDESVLKRLKDVANLKPEQQLGSVRSISHLDTMVVDSKSNWKIGNATSRFVMGTIYVFVATVVSRIVQITCTDAVFREGVGKDFRNANIISLVFLICIPVWVFIGIHPKVGTRTFMIGISICFYALVLSAAAAIGAALVASALGPREIFYALSWADWIPRLNSTAPSRPKMVLGQSPGPPSRALYELLSTTFCHCHNSSTSAL